MDATRVYWTTASNCDTVPCSGAVVSSVPIGGGTVTTLASNYGPPSGFAVDSTSVYFTDGESLVIKVPLGGGSPVTLASGQLGAGGIAVDATSVYWTNADPDCCNDDGSVVRLTPK